MLNMINKLFKVSITLAAIIFLNSCEKKILDVTPYSSFTDATAFTTPERVALALNGVYDAAQSGFYAGGVVRGYPFGAASVEQGDMRGEDMLNQAAFYQITYEATYNDVSGNNSFHFQTLYSLINVANLTIEGVQKAALGGIITAPLGTQYEAECRFLRALAHHELVLHFARPYTDGGGTATGIIFREFGINSEATVEAARALKRATVGENYAKILADLDFAETNLPDISPLKTFRVSKAGAIALKMRVKLHKGDWAGVITDGNKIVPAAAPYTSPIGGWKLMATPGGAFTAPWTSDESLFSIRNDATDNPGVNGSLPNMLGNPAAAPVGVGGRGLVRISPVIWNASFWLCDDLRRTSLTSTDGGAGFYTTKYKDVTTQADAAPQIRYAEVLLTLAEAEARVAAGTVSQRALDLLNAVRNRALALPVVQAYTLAGFATQNDLIRAILNERRIEFLAEGKRWGDISRLAKDANFAPVPGGGIPSKVGSGGATAAMFNCATPPVFPRSVPEIPYADNRFIWPIPIVEIQQNPNFSQNPGY